MEIQRYHEPARQCASYPYRKNSETSFVCSYETKRSGWRKIDIHFQYFSLFICSI